MTEASGNYNYTRSLAYNLLPFYHAGIRAYTPSYKGLVVTGYFVNNLYNTATEGVHHQGDYAGIVQLNYANPGGKFTAISSFGFGNDLLGGVKTREFINDTDFIYNLNATQLVGLNYDYAQFKPSDGGPHTVQSGYAAYYRQQLTPKTAGAIRFSGFNSRTSDTQSLNPYEVTLTYEYKAATNFTTRLEYRHDHSNQNSYLGKDDSAFSGTTKKNEDLLLLAGLFSF